MCELLALSSLEPVRLTFSLQALASHSGGTSTSRDGWGAAFYQGNDVALYREPSAAMDSPLVRFLQTQGPSTTLAISHIRHATQGGRTLANTQPFVRELCGRAHVFAHNGNLTGIATDSRLAFGHYMPIGTTDSEHAFCGLLERLHELWVKEPGGPALDVRRRAVQAFAGDLRRLGPANFLYADGDALFAHGHRRIQRVSGSVEPPGLWRLSRHCALPGDTVVTEGVAVAPGFQELTLVASVPLNEETWTRFEEGETVVLRSGRLVE